MEFNVVSALKFEKIVEDSIKNRLTYSSAQLKL